MDTVLPYYLGLSERIGKIVRSARIGVASRLQCTIRNVISKLKDSISTDDKAGVVYHSSCRDCDHSTLAKLEGISNKG